MHEVYISRKKSVICPLVLCLPTGVLAHLEKTVREVEESAAKSILTVADVQLLLYCRSCIGNIGTIDVCQRRGDEDGRHQDEKAFPHSSFANFLEQWREAKSGSEALVVSKGNEAVFLRVKYVSRLAHAKS